MAAILRAQDIQAPDDPARTLAERRERAIRRAIAGALASLAALATSAAVLALLARFNADGAAGAVIDAARPALTAGYQPIADLFDEAARQAANDNFSGAIIYDPQASAADIAANRDAFIEAIRAGVRETIREVLVTAIRDGASPQEAAPMLAKVIGLNAQQAKAVLNFRQLLERGDPGALQRALRDRRFDATIEAAIRGERSLSEEQIEAMVQRYAERALAYRAETIARTESMQAAVGGMRQAYVQAVDRGHLLDGEVRRFWLTAADERVCPVCSSIPLFNRRGRGVNEPYQSIDGSIIAPLAHPRCRCSERYVANLTRLQQQPFDLAA